MLKCLSKIKKKSSASHLTAPVGKVNTVTVVCYVFMRIDLFYPHYLCALYHNKVLMIIDELMEVKIISKDLLLNEEIREKEIRLIDSNGEQLGIVPTRKAMEMAETKQLDLVMISQQAKPPVCKIMDYSKYLYEVSKKEKEARKNQKVINIKEIRFSPNIEEHDLSVKAKNAEKFLKEGDKVKVTIRFRGRETDYSHLGQNVMNQFAERLSSVGDIEKEAKLEGRNLIMILKPKKA